MAIADYGRERDLRKAIFSTQTKNIEDFKNFVEACSVYMQNKKIDMINLSLTFDFLESPEEEKKKLNQ